MKALLFWKRKGLYALCVLLCECVGVVLCYVGGCVLWAGVGEGASGERQTERQRDRETENLDGFP